VGETTHPLAGVVVRQHTTSLSLRVTLVHQTSTLSWWTPLQVGTQAMWHLPGMNVLEPAKRAGKKYQSGDDIRRTVFWTVWNRSCSCMRTRQEERTTHQTVRIVAIRSPSK